MSDTDRPVPAGDPGSQRPWPQRPEGWRHDAPDPPDAFAVPFTWGHGVVLAGWSILAQFTAVIPFLAFGIDPQSGLNLYWFLFLAQALTLLGIYLYLRSRGAWTWHLLGPVRPRWKHVPLGIGVGVVGYLIVVVLGAMRSSWSGRSSRRVRSSSSAASRADSRRCWAWSPGSGSARSSRS